MNSSDHKPCPSPTVTVTVASSKLSSYYPRESNPDKQRALVEEMIPLVGQIVARMSLYFPPHTSRDDLINAGVIGLIDAVHRYDPTKGSSLKSYCGVRIRGAILDELRRLDWVPRSVHQDAKRLEEVQDRLARELDREPTEDELANAMGLTREAFDQLLDRVKPCTYISLQEPIGDSEDGDALTHEEVLPDSHTPDAVMSLLKAEDTGILRETLKKLPKQQLLVLTLYYMESMRLKEIAEVMSITESRVSQIHTLAITRLRSAFFKARNT